MDIDNEETRQLLKLLELEDLSALGLYMEYKKTYLKINYFCL
jgi:hypothetical protein